MPVTMLHAVEFSKIPALQFVVPVVSADPTAYEAGLIYNSVEKLLKYGDGTGWKSIGSGTPTGPAGGDLSGTYPNPQIAAGVIVDADVNAANKDGAAGTPSMRTLGTGANQAAPGNDSRFTDSRPPTGAAGGDLSGTYPNPQIAAGVIVDADVAAANKDGAVATPSMRTLGFGAQQALAGTSRLDQIAAPTAPVSMNSQKITNLAEPVAFNDAATRIYVDQVATGLDAKQSVKAATTANITLSGPQTIDGVALVAQDRVLVKDQTTASANGIYTVLAGAWVRALDMDSWTEVPSAYTWVEQGTVNGDTGWVCVADQSGSMGTTNIVWSQFSGSGVIQAGAGLTKTGNVIDVVGDANLSVAADLVSVLSAPKWTTARSFTLTGDVTGTVAAVDGSANVSIATTVASVANMTKHFAGDIPAGTACVVTHNLNTRDVKVEVYRNSGAYDTVLADVERTSVNTVTIKFASAVTAGQFRAVVQGR